MQNRSILSLIALQSNFAKRLAGTFFLRITTISFSFLTSILLARILGPYEYGVYTYVIMLITLIGTPVTLALHNLVVRQTAAFQATSSWELLNGIRKWAVNFVLMGSIVIATFSGLTAWLFRDSLDQYQYHTFLYALIILPIQALNTLRAALLKGLHYIVLGQIPDAVVKPGSFIILLLSTLYLFEIHPIKSNHAVLLNILSCIFAFVIGSLLLKTRIPKQLILSDKKFAKRAWFKSVSTFSFSSGLKDINKHLPVLLLGPMAGPESVAVFVIASRGAELIALVLTAMNMVLAPIFSKLYASGNMKELQRIVTISSRLILVISLPAAVILISFSLPLIETIFGQEYAAGAQTLVILSVGQIIHSLAGSVGLLLNMTVHERLVATAFGFAAIINFILNLALIPIWGIEGSAVAAVVSTTIWNILAAIWVVKRLQIYPTALGERVMSKWIKT